MLALQQQHKHNKRKPMARYPPDEMRALAPLLHHQTRRARGVRCIESHRGLSICVGKAGGTPPKPPSHQSIRRPTQERGVMSGSWLACGLACLPSASSAAASCVVPRGLPGSLAGTGAAWAGMAALICVCSLLKQDPSTHPGSLTHAHFSTGRAAPHRGPGGRIKSTGRRAPLDDGNGRGDDDTTPPPLAFLLLHASIDRSTGVID